jgi:tetratricopeptide (TPR) repeat protein
MRRFRLAAACLLLLVLAGHARAQIGTGRLFGTVKDERGRPLKGATITAQNDVYFPRSFTAATDAKGRFSLLGLRRATYKITVRAEGFDSAVVDLPVASGGANPPLDIRLTPALAPGPPPLLPNVDAAKLQHELKEAAALAADGRTDEAIAAYRKIAQSTPALTSVHLQLGYLYERKGDRAAAIAAYKAALDGDAGNARARDALGRLKKP